MLEGSILQQLAVSHQSGTPGKRRLNFGVYYKNTLVALCHALEDYILAAHSAPLVITAFQRGKWYLQEADRYGALADKAQQIVIMAAPDAGFADHPTSQRSNVDLVSLEPQDPVAQEWHLIILSPSYTAMVLCQELSDADYGPDGPPREDLERKFYGLWTFEPELVRETMELAIAHLQPYNPALQQQLMAQVDSIVQAAHSTPQDDMGAVVSQVVDYLHQTQEHLPPPTQTQFSALPRLQSLDLNLTSNELQAFLRLAQLIDASDATNPMAAAEVATLAEFMGQLLDLPSWQLHRLRLTALLHRIDPLQTTRNFLPSSHVSPAGAAASCPLTCPLVPGAQILRTMPRLKAIAAIINHQTEWWNGSGQPGGLAGDEIPLESRILGLMAEFQGQVTALRQASLAGSNPLTLEECFTQGLAHCQAQAGERWDPKLVDTLALLVAGLQQGLNLNVTAPKIAAGLWMLDSHCEEDLAQLTATYRPSITTTTHGY